MCHRFIGGAVLAAAAVLAGPASGRAQDPGSPSSWSPAYGLPIIARGQAMSDIGGLNPPLNTYPTIPIPTGNTADAGFYTSVEYVMLTQTRDIGNQVIAFRGLVDSSGQITGLPGIYVGSGQVGLTTEEFARTTFSPGFQVEIGYKFEDGTRVFANYMHLFDAHYKTGASLATPFFRSRPDLVDTFLVAPVFNFPPQFAGPRLKTGFDLSPGSPGFTSYGIWNGATVMNIQYTQRYNQSEIGARVPMYQTEYSRIYGIAEGKFAWLFDRFQWYTLSMDVNGVANPQDQAWYTNTLSQRLYGPVVGCGHEVFFGNQFSLSCDLTAGLLLGVVKERVKYKLENFFGDTGQLQPVASKASYDTWQLVPNANAALNLWWYPTEGVQLRIGYQAMTYFNTTRMQEAVGFNYATPDPRYETQVFRILHGLNVGVGLFF